MSIPNVKSGHIGRKIERIRELKGIKQEALAVTLGVSQQTVSKMEQSKHIDDEKLQLVADALGISVETIKNFNEDAAINNINSFYDNSTVSTLINAQFNSTEKIVELYERLLESERKRNEMLEAQLKAKK